MMNNRAVGLRFTDQGRQRIGRIGLGALVVLLGAGCVLYTLWQSSVRGLFEYVGADFRLWYATAEIIRDHGFVSTYDPSVQAEYQLSLFEQYSHHHWSSIPFWTMPLPYLPLFTAGMVLLLIFPPVTGFTLSIVVKTTITLLYLWSLAKRNEDTDARKIPTPLVLLSLPVFFNLFFSGMNLWLLIAFGESLMALRRGRKLQAGLWMAGLLLKPQTLILFIPGFLLTRRTRVLTGFLIGSAVVGCLSLLLAGPSAVLGPLRVISQWPSIYAESGMNWRALGLNSSYTISKADSVFWLIVGTGSVVTTVAALRLWLSRPRQELGPLLYLGTYAATCALAWSSNVYMALPLLAPGVLLWAEGKLPTILACFWLFFPTSVFLTLALTCHPGAHNIAGISALVANLVVLTWSVRASQQALGTPWGIGLAPDTSLDRSAIREEP